MKNVLFCCNCIVELKCTKYIHSYVYPTHTYILTQNNVHKIKCLSFIRIRELVYENIYVCMLEFNCIMVCIYVNVDTYVYRRLFVFVYFSCNQAF